MANFKKRTNGRESLITWVVDFCYFFTIINPVLGSIIYQSYAMFQCVLFYDKNFLLTVLMKREGILLTLVTCPCLPLTC